MAGNAAVIEAAIEAFNAGDVEAMLVVADPDLEWRPVFGAATLGATTYRGHSGFRDYWRAAQEVWAGFRFTPDRFIESGDQVVVIGRGSGHARESGIEIDQPFAMLWRLRGGKTVFGQTFVDPLLALRAAGLETDATAQPGSPAGGQVTASSPDSAQMQQERDASSSRTSSEIP